MGIQRSRGPAASAEESATDAERPGDRGPAHRPGSAVRDRARARARRADAGLQAARSAPARAARGLGRLRRHRVSRLQRSAALASRSTRAWSRRSRRASPSASGSARAIASRSSPRTAPSGSSRSGRRSRSARFAVGLNGWWAGDEILYGLEDSDPKLLIGDRKRLARIAGAPLRMPVVEIESEFEKLWSHDLGAALPDVPIAEDDPATILYTSGTTGRPKGAVNTHRNIIALCRVQMFHGIRSLMLGGGAGRRRRRSRRAPACSSTRRCFTSRGSTPAPSRCSRPASRRSGPPAASIPCR